MRMQTNAMGITPVSTMRNFLFPSGLFSVAACDSAIGPERIRKSYGYQIGYPYYSPISRPLPPRLPVKPASIGMIIVWHAMKQKHVASTNIAFLEKIPFPEIFSFPDKISFSMSEFSYAPRN